MFDVTALTGVKSGTGTRLEWGWWAVASAVCIDQGSSDLPRIFWPTGSTSGAQGLSAQASSADLAGNSAGSTLSWGWGGTVHWYFPRHILQLCSDRARKQLWGLVPCAWCVQGLQQPHLATSPNTFLEFLCLALYPSLLSNSTLGSPTSLEKRKSPKVRPKHSKYLNHFTCI